SHDAVAGANVLPTAMPAAASVLGPVPTLARNAAANTPGHRERPKNTKPASAMPVALFFPVIWSE
ncbi:MAG: hypothetical protein ABR607_17445, partial [Pyrinomonadaceae bacterium]